MEVRIEMYPLKTNPMKDWKTLEDLRYYKIGATRGYTYTKAFWDLANTKRLRVDVSDSDIQNFKKLFNGRIGLFPSGLVNGYDLLLKDFGVSKSHLLTYHLNPLTRTRGHLAFTRSRQDSGNLLPIFNDGLAELKKEGLYDQFREDLIEGRYRQ